MTVHVRALFERRPGELMDTPAIDQLALGAVPPVGDLVRIAPDRSYEVRQVVWIPQHENGSYVVAELVLR